MLTTLRQAMRRRETPQSQPRVRTIRKALDLVGRDQWRRWVLLVVLAVVMSGFEMAGAALVYVLLSLVADPTGAIDLPLIGDLRPVFAGVDQRSLLLSVIGVLAGFFVLRGIMRVGVAYVQARIAHNTGARLSNRLVSGYLRAPYAFHLRRNSAELIRNGHQATQQLVGQVFLPMIGVGADALLALGLLLVMVAVAPLAAAIALGVVGSAATILLFFVQPRLKRLGQVAHGTNRETLSVLQQGLHGIRDIKLLGRERWFERTYARSRMRMARAFYLRSALSQLPGSVTELSLIGFILVFFAITLFGGDGGAASTLSVLGLFAYVGLRLQPSVQRIIGGLNSLKFSNAPLDDLHADLIATRHLAPSQGAVERLAFREAINLDGVSFRYDGANAEALRNVDLTIRRGEEIGICGPTGGGKTTLVDLIAGLLEPTNGTVTVDGVDIRDKVRAWQQNLGVVSQAVFLLDGTIRDNIALGVPGGDIDDEALREAVRVAQLEEFVASLPEGLDTQVGERGMRISGGERQRIAIARALYRRPEVLIFDEGTSALDNTTEAELMGALPRLRGERTVLFVAHRLSTVRESDRLIFVEAGRITGEGHYDELVANHRSFRVMAGAP